MAYFSNGTEGQMYQEKYCQRCKHDVDEDCPIWAAHLVYVGHGDKYQEVLDLLIPMEKQDGGVKFAGKCTMFIPCDEQTPVLPRPIIEEHVKEVGGIKRLVF